MYPVVYQLIMADFDITHQAQIRTPWKIWILCHMSAYQNNIMMDPFFASIEMRPTQLQQVQITYEDLWKP